MSLERLLEAVRDGCPRGLWSQGVKLARDGAVTRSSANAEEIVLRVAAPGFPIAPTVVLYPKGGEWECDCSSQFDACAHVAAAVIAVTQGAETPAAEPPPAAAFHYRLEEDDRGRMIVRREVIGAAPVHPTTSDLDAGRLLDAQGRARIEAAMARQLCAALAGCDRVTLSGRPIEVAAEPVLPRGLVSDRGEGVRLSVVADPSVTEIVADGVALCGRVLAPLGHTEVAGARWELLPLVRDYAPPELAELVTTMLPALKRDVQVDVRTRRLPRVTRDERPHVAFAIESEGDRLAVLPTLVYGDPPLARVDGDRLVQLRAPSPAPVRDRGAEAGLITSLRDRLNMVPGRRVTAVGAEAKALVDRVRAFERGEDPTPREEGLFEVPLSARLVVRDEPDGATDFELWFETDQPVDGQRRRATAGAVAAAWRSGLELVPLDGGGWAPLPHDFMARHGQRVLDLLAARAGAERVPAVAVAQLAALCDALEQPRPLAAGRLAALLGEGESIPSATLPAGFRGELRPYQRAGVDWLCFLRDAGFGAVLADDMGLGKTVQMLAALRGRTLVVCPTSVLHNWEAEVSRFRPDLRTCVYHGARRELDDTADVVVTSYALLRLDRERLGAVRWSCLVLDEAQAIKNPDSQQAQAAFALAADFRVALSGTPIENRLEELWSVCHATNPGLLGGRTDFQRRLATPIATGRADAAAFLRDKIRPFVLRRTKRQVAPELPPRTEVVVTVELGEEERAIYDAVRAASRDDVVARLAGGGGNVMEALEALLRLRQAACHPALLPGQHADSSSKVAALVEALDTAAADGHKALVFSQWTSLLDLVEPHLRANQVGFLRLDGSTVDRGGVVRAYQDAGGPPVLLASLKAGGTGLNLTAADHVFILDPWWNPASEDQAADRAHRIGQDRPVMIYRLVARGTVEERILALQARKRDLASAALGDADRAASLTREDLLALLA